MNQWTWGIPSWTNPNRFVKLFQASFWFLWKWFLVGGFDLNMYNILLGSSSQIGFENRRWLKHIETYWNHQPACPLDTNSKCHVPLDHPRSDPWSTATLGEDRSSISLLFLGSLYVRNLDWFKHLLRPVPVFSLNQKSRNQNHIVSYRSSTSGSCSRKQTCIWSGHM